MSFRRRRTRRPRSRRRTRSFRRSGLKSIRGARLQVLRNSRKIAKISRMIEKKTLDVAEVMNTGTSEVFYMGKFLVGPKDGERIGRRIDITSIQIKMELRRATTATIHSAVRVIIFRDKQNEAALPLVTDVLEGNQINDLRNKTNFARFDIVKDVTFNWPTPGESASTQKNITFFLKPKGSRAVMQWLFSATSTINVNQGGKNMWYMLILDSQSASPDATNKIWTTRIRYMDA